MRNLLDDPRYPNLVEEWAGEASELQGCANDNAEEDVGHFADLLLTVLAQLEIGATRLW
jgi:hypothetical protein